MAERTVRAEITTQTVRDALEAARQGTETINYADARQPGLILRVRGHSISWLVKTRKLSRRLGSPPLMMIRDARSAAAQLHGEIKSGKLAPIQKTSLPAAVQLSDADANEQPQSVWTLADLFLRFEIDRAEPRIIKNKVRDPAAKTLAEIDLAFRREAWNPYRTMPLDQLSDEHISAALHSIQNAVSPPQARKAMRHVKAALEWASGSLRASAAGLRGVQRWWRLIELDEPSGEAATKMVARSRPTANPDFKIEHLAVALTRHDEFCQGQHRVSAAVRWGFWWIALSAARRGAATMIRREDVSRDHPELPSGWSLVKWQAEAMKMRGAFWLPVPPMGSTIMRNAQTGWLEEMERAGRTNRETVWIFPSNTRVTKTGKDRDAPLSEYALTTHLACMRGKRGNSKSHRNLLADLPHFTLHSIRGLMASWVTDTFDDDIGAASVMLDHRTVTEREKAEGVSTTTRKFYDTAQRLALKRRVMHAWSDGLIDAYEAAGGRTVFPRSDMVTASLRIPQEAGR